MLKTLIIIPVLNEEKNILPIHKRIKKYVHYKNDILFIDDDSNDGTQKMIMKIKKKFKNIQLMKRYKKIGIGSAHKDGLNWGYKKKYKIVVTLDCDGTHDPVHINKMIYLINKNKYQIISTNRFLKKNSLKDWTVWRKFLTYFRHFLIVIMLGMKYDSSGAFRCYNISQINPKDILRAESNSYSFFWESMFFLSKKYKIYEIPISLPGRLAGTSKMNLGHITGALLYLIKFFLKNRF